MRKFLLLCALVGGLSVVGCSGGQRTPENSTNLGAGDDGGTADASTSSDAGTTTGTADGSVPATTGTSGGHRSTDYPAFVADFPQLQNNGGPVLTAPKIVTVTWAGDPNAAALNAFADGLGATDYWHQVTAEYGIGPATSGLHVSTSDSLGASTSDQALDQFVSDHVLAAPGNGWPAWDGQTIYMLYVPSNVAVSMGGQDGCSQADAYHSETSAGTYAHVMYGVVMQKCAQDLIDRGVESDMLSFDTGSASHEIIETATDPHAQSDMGFVGPDNNHFAWEMWTQGNDETGDWCEFFADAMYTEASPFSYTVQRTWSNAAARAGHNPCTPAPKSAFFIATPLNLGPITTSFQRQTFSTQGFAIPVGGSKTIQVGLASDAPTGDWNVDVMEGDGMSSSAGHLTFSPDHFTGNNGETFSVTITLDRNATGPNLVTLVAYQGHGYLQRFMPFLVEGQ